MWITHSNIGLCRVMPPRPENRRGHRARYLRNDDEGNGGADPPPPPPLPPNMLDPMQFWAQATQFMTTMMANMQTIQQQQFEQ
ncbi:hypothetical protein SLA2020_350590 [Shorea laevis]